MRMVSIAALMLAAAPPLAAKGLVDPCARPLRPGETVRLCHVTIDRHLFGSGDQAQVFAALVTDSPATRDASVSFTVFRADGEALPEDGSLVADWRPSGYPGPGAPTRRARAAGAPHLLGAHVASLLPQTLALIRWTDAAGAHERTLLLAMTVVG